MSKRKPVSDAVLDAALTKFGIAPASPVSLSVKPSFFRQDTLGYWKWFIANNKSPSLTSADLKQTVLNHLVSFLCFMLQMKYKVFEKSSSETKAIGTHLDIANNIASNQAARLNNMLTKLYLPRRLLALKHKIIEMDVGSSNPNLYVSSFFRVTGIVVYKAKTSMLYHKLLADAGSRTNIPANVRSWMISAARPNITVQQLIAYTQHNSPAITWLSVVEEHGISIDLTATSDNVVAFRYSVALDCCLFMAANAQKKMAAIWQANFYPV